MLNSKRNKNIQDQPKVSDNDSSLNEDNDKSCDQILITSARNITRLPHIISNIEKIPSKRDHSEQVVVRENRNTRVIDKRIQVYDQSIKQVDIIVALKYNYSELAVKKEIVMKSAKYNENKKDQSTQSNIRKRQRDSA